MSEQEESNDQMEAQDTNDNSVRNFNFIVERLKLQQKVFSSQPVKFPRMNLRLQARRKKPTLTPTEVRDLTFC